MKKLLLLITIFTVMFTACGSDDDNDNGGGTINTSFVVKNAVDATQKNVVAGYFAKDGKCKKIATIGDMAYNHTSSEIKVTNSDITEVFLFVTRGSGESYKLTPGFRIEKNKKNSLTITNDMQPVTAKENDDTQYPH